METMGVHDERSLLDILQEVASLSEYMRDDAIKNIVAEWRRKSPIVDEVVSGRTTFETAIKALVEENSKLRWLNYRRGVCNSEEFKRMAENSRERFTGILSLSHTYIPFGRVSLPRLDDLTAVVSLKETNFLWQLMVIAIVAVTPSLTWIGFGYFLDRKFMAELPWVTIAGLGLGLLLAGGLLFSGFPHYLSRRRWLAQQILERVRFLDAMLAPQPF